MVALLWFADGPADWGGWVGVHTPDAVRLPQGNHVTVPWDN